MKLLSETSISTDKKILLPIEVIKHLNLNPGDNVKFLLNQYGDVIIDKKGPKLIEVTLNYDFLEDVFYTYNHKGKKVNCVTLNSSLYLQGSSGNLIHGIVKRDLDKFKDSEGYFFYSKNCPEIPFTKDFKFFICLDENERVISDYQVVESIMSTCKEVY